MTLTEEIKKRRTFAIISHPDAGKTTLTEKLLLYGGAIHLAGSIKSRKTQRHAVSDWMEIEKQRGISVTSSVLQFDYAGCRINILDTPGHQDFSEDTYRTLMAVDSAVMILDAAKGVEAQTKKLFKVCRERRIPIFTFINKLDRYGKVPLDLLDEIEKVLGIPTYPMNFPIGTDGKYLGVFDRQKNRIELFAEDTTHGQQERSSEIFSPDDPEVIKRIGQENFNALQDDLMLLDEAGEIFDKEKIYNASKAGWRCYNNFYIMAKSGMSYKKALNYALQGKVVIEDEKKEYPISIALVSHGYNIYDDRTCMKIFDKLEAMDVKVYTSLQLSKEQLTDGIASLGNEQYWANEFEMTGSAGHYLKDGKIDGIITLTAFGCGPDSLMIERVTRKAKRFNKPLLNLTIDEHTGEAGFITRLEAFVDMLYRKKRAEIVNKIDLQEHVPNMEYIETKK